MTRHRKLLLSAWIVAIVCLQLASMATRREWWPFSPITMYSGTQPPVHTGLALIAVEPDGREVVLSPDQTLGPHPYVFVYRVLSANPSEPEAIAWASGLYAEQRRHEGRSLPAAFELARLTWKLRVGGDRNDPWQRKVVLARHTY